MLGRVNSLGKKRTSDFAATTIIFFLSESVNGFFFDTAAFRNYVGVLFLGYPVEQ